MSFDPNWVSSVAALVAVAFSIWAHLSAEVAKKRMDALAHQIWSDEYFREISAWASSVCLTISEAINLESDENSNIRKSDLLARLTSNIDIGRWYFPNRHDDKKGVFKEPAYRGERQPCLDWLVFAYDILHDNNFDRDKKIALTQCHRQFVSCIQEKINPRQREKAIEHILRDFGVVSSLPKVESPEKKKYE